MNGFAGGAGASGAGFGFEDIFSSIFGGGMGGSSRTRSNSARRGRDIQTDITITFEEAAFGVEKMLQLLRWILVQSVVDVVLNLVTTS